MSQRLKLMGITAGLVSFFLCLAGGTWLLVNSGFNPKEPLGAGLGLYFIGKAFFVGPMLFITIFKKEDR